MSSFHLQKMSPVTNAFTALQIFTCQQPAVHKKIAHTLHTCTGMGSQ